MLCFNVGRNELYALCFKRNRNKDLRRDIRKIHFNFCNISKDQQHFVFREVDTRITLCYVNGRCPISTISF